MQDAFGVQIEFRSDKDLVATSACAQVGSAGILEVCMAVGVLIDGGDLRFVD